MPSILYHYHPELHKFDVILLVPHWKQVGKWFKVSQLVVDRFEMYIAQLQRLAL